MRYCINILFLIMILPVFGQYYGNDKIEKSQLRPWREDSIEQYSRTYFFGFSEGECELRIFISDTIIFAQRSCFIWGNNEIGFVDTFYNYSNLRIIGNRLYSNEIIGEFMILENENNLVSGLLIENPWTYEFYEGGEFGSAYQDLSISGEYQIASTKILKPSDLQKYKSVELRLMRNEIYARYGYVFIPDGEMDNYFRAKSWYRPYYSNVDGFLTTIEKYNISLIIKEEKSR